MDVNTFIQIVNGIGFPIAACIAMGVFIVWDKKTRNEHQKTQMEKQEEMFFCVNNNIRVVRMKI